MQTFLPLSDFAASARCLDRQRLGKQRVECLQILRTLRGKIQSTGWQNHPAVAMWRGYELSLIDYGVTICREWTHRGYRDTCREKIESLDVLGWVSHPPPWLGDNEFHRSHRSNLLRKDPVHYGQFGWTEPSDLPYIWPSKEKIKMKFANVPLTDLQIAHSEMCATAVDIGLKIPKDLSVEITTEVQGVPICEELHALIEKFRSEKALAPGEGKAQGDAPKSRDVKSGLETDKKIAAQKAARLKKAEGNGAPAEPSKKGSVKETGEEPVSKKTAAKKKATPKKAAAKKSSTPRTKFPPEAKITWVAKENPAREGSARYDRYEKLRKASGKTVDTAIKSGVPSATIANAQAAKVITVK